MVVLEMMRQSSHSAARAFKPDKEHTSIEMVQTQDEQRQPGDGVLQFRTTDKKQATRRDHSTSSDCIQSLRLEAAAQLAESKTFIDACRLAKGHTANTPSRKAFGGDPLTVIQKRGISEDAKE